MQSTPLLKRIGILGDIHCEDRFLAMAIDYFQSANLDLIVSVGDIVDGQGDLDQCCALLKEHNICTVRGNHERWFLRNSMRDLPNANLMTDVKDRTKLFIISLPTYQELNSIAGKILLCHGIGDNDMASIYADNIESSLQFIPELQQIVTRQDYQFIINGHTHNRMINKVRNLTVINAGTLAHYHEPCFAIADFEAHKVTFYNFIDQESFLEAETFGI